MTTAAILQQAGLVPTVPTPSRELGTPESKAQSLVPSVPSVPAQNNEGAAAIGNAAIELGLKLTAVQLAAYRSMQNDFAERMAGRAPAGDTATMVCTRCGPVYIHPTIAAVLPVVDGWPRALGCPWCFVRKAGGSIPSPSNPTACAIQHTERFTRSQGEHP